jgi:hypothetical protein
MRIGSNPEKTSKPIVLDNYHRIVIPVYIPNFDGYFKDAFDIFKLCLESLLLTVHSKSRITIYNNNCHIDVKHYIEQRYNESNLIDQVFHSKENVGKINAILAAVKGNLEPFITITDADVLFINNWQVACESIFDGFPEAGMVSPVANPKLFNAYNANNWYYALIKGKLYFEKNNNPEGVLRFFKSLGNENSNLNSVQLENFLILENNKKSCKAVMGCGHFVAVMRREIFDKGVTKPALFKIGLGIENKFIDKPNEDLGYLRLATLDNLAFHMGNTIEAWMYEKFNSLIPDISEPVVNDIPNYLPRGKSLLGVLISRALKINVFKRLILGNRGLKKDILHY